MEEKMELRILSPSEFIDHIDCNWDEIKAKATELVKNYENIVYTDETIKDAEKDRAYLNNVVKQMEEERKRIKKMVLAPYEAFEEEYKKVLLIVKDVATKIDKQVKEAEEAHKAEKKAKIRKAYDEYVGDLASILPFEKVFDPAYLLKKWTEAKAIKDMEAKIDKARADLTELDALDSKYKVNAKDVYLKTLDLSEAMKENRRLIELEEKMEAEKKRREQEEAERRAREEEERRKEKERLTNLAEAAANEARLKQQREEAQKAAEQPAAEEPKEVPKEEPKQEPAATVKRYTVSFMAYGTKDQLEGLVKYMKENEIQYKEIK